MLWSLDSNRLYVVGVYDVISMHIHQREHYLLSNKMFIHMHPDTVENTSQSFHKCIVKVILFLILLAALLRNSNKS